MRFSRIRGRLHYGEDGETEMKSEKEVTHSSRSSSKSYLCIEAGQPYPDDPGGEPQDSQSSTILVRE